MTKIRLTVSAAAGLVAATALMGGVQDTVGAQSRAPTKLTGIINDYVEAGGAWHVSGEWSAHLKRDSATADFLASLTMMRSDLWVLLTNADPTNPSLRQPHTHHVSVVDAPVTTIANGWRLGGAALITSNGIVAGFSGSPIVVEITGGNPVHSANVKLTFSDAATAHFGEQPLDGVVVFRR